MLEIKRGTLVDAMPLLLHHHYLGRRTADPIRVYLLPDDSACAVFTAPANRYFNPDAVELSRLVRKPDVTLPMSRFVSACLKRLRIERPELRYCLSYADSAAGHHGGIYQACSFTHVRVSKGHTHWRHKETGKLVSSRSFDQQTDREGYERVPSGDKYLYVYPLAEKRDKLLARFGWLALPYPKPLIR